MSREFSKSFYRTKAWQAARGEALRRDHFTCQRCGARAEEVHHIIELTPENIRDRHVSLNVDLLESLCHNCHTRETQGSDGDLDRGYIFDADGHVVEL